MERQDVLQQRDVLKKVYNLIDGAIMQSQGVMMYLSDHEATGQYKALLDVQGSLVEAQRLVIGVSAQIH